MKDKIRVVVADDSAYARLAITKALRLDAAMEVVGQARDGVQAVEMVKDLKPDVLTLDITMPRMDGLAALGHIMSEQPTPVVMVSALTGPQTKATVEALELGAVDFFLKQGTTDKTRSNGVSAELIRKVRLAADATVSKFRTPPRPKANPPVRQAPRKGPSGKISTVVVIGTSTGGPRALAGLIPWIPADLPAAFLIVQHMPSGFTKSLAERLDQASPMTVREAAEGDALKAGQALVAPGNFHMTIARHGIVSLNQDPPVWGVRPAVDITMESVVSAYGKAAHTVVLTGMGSDGSRGASLVKKAGGRVVVEHESTCAVYGMPKSIVEAGDADVVLPLEKIADEIKRMCR